VDPVTIIMLIISIVSLILSIVLAPKPKNAVQKPIGGLPTINQGTPIPVVFGQRRVTALFVTWWGDVKTEAIKADSGK
jgi:hypothetical protein